MKIWAKCGPTFDFKKWHPTFPEKHKKTFFWRSYQKKVFMIS